MHGGGGFKHHVPTEGVTYHGKTIAEQFRDAVNLARSRAFLTIQDKTRIVMQQFQDGKLTQEEFRNAISELMGEAIEVLEKQ